MQRPTAKLYPTAPSETVRAGWWSTTFRALQYRNFRLFWTGQLISLIGTWMQSVAQQILVYRLTNSASKLGIVAAAGTLPVLFLSLWAGVLVDRLPKRTIILATQIASMLLAFVLAALVYFDVVQFWHIVVLATLLGCVNAIDMPARQAFVPEMVDRSLLGNAVALNSSIFNAARVVGPAIAGIMVALVGTAMAFTINGVSFIAVIAGLLMMRLPPHEPQRSNGTALYEIVDGLRYVAGEPLKRVLMIALLIQTVFGTFQITLMPVFARDVFVVRGMPLLQDDSARLGFLSAAYGVGALIAALALASMDERIKRGTRIVVGLILYPASFVLFAFAPSFWLALPLLVVGGWAMITLLATANTLFQTTTPDALRGRVMSLYTLVLVGLMPLGSLLAGFLTEYFGSAPIALALGHAVVLATGIVVFFFSPQVRQAT